MKKIFILMILLISCKSFSALPFMIGVEGGYTLNQLNTSTGYRYFTEYRNRSGFLIGIPVHIPLNVPMPLNGNFALGSGLRYIQKNYTYERTFPNTILPYPVYSDYTNGFLQLPIFADFSLGKNKSRVFLDLGMTFDFWLHSNRQGNLLGLGLSPISFNERAEFNSIRDKRLQAALLAGLGYRYVLREITSFVSVGYHYGLTDMQKNYMERGQIARYNNTFAVNAGFLFGRLR